MQHVKGAMAEAAAASAMASEAGAEAGDEAGAVSELGEGVASPASDASGGGEVGEVGEAVLGDDRVVHAEKADAGDSPTEKYCGGNGCFDDKSRTECKMNGDKLAPCPDGYTQDEIASNFVACKTRKCKLNEEAGAAVGGTAAVPPTPTKLQDPDQDNLTEEMSLPE